MLFIKIENNKKKKGDKFSPWRTPIFQQKKSDDIPFYFLINILDLFSSFFV